MLSKETIEELYAVDATLKANTGTGICVAGHNLDELLKICHYKKGTKEIVEYEDCYDENGNWKPEFSMAHYYQSLDDEDINKLFDYIPGKVIKSIEYDYDSEIIYHYIDGTSDVGDDCIEDDEELIEQD